MSCHKNVWAAEIQKMHQNVWASLLSTRCGSLVGARAILTPWAQLRKSAFQLNPGLWLETRSVANWLMTDSRWFSRPDGGPHPPWFDRVSAAPGRERWAILSPWDSFQLHWIFCSETLDILPLYCFFTVRQNFTEWTFTKTFRRVESKLAHAVWKYHILMPYRTVKKSGKMWSKCGKYPGFSWNALLRNWAHGVNIARAPTKLPHRVESKLAHTFWCIFWISAAHTFFDLDIHEDI